MLVPPLFECFLHPCNGGHLVYFDTVSQLEKPQLQLASEQDKRDAPYMMTIRRF